METLWKVSTGGRTLYLLTNTRFKSTGKEIAKHFAIEKILKIKMPKRVLYKTPKQERAYENTTVIEINYIDITNKKSIRDIK